MGDVPDDPDGEQREGPSVPEQVEDVDRPLQGAGHEHPDLLEDVRLGVKRREAEEQHERYKYPVVQHAFHALPSLRPANNSLIDMTSFNPVPADPGPA